MSKISALAQDFERSAIERSRATDEAVRSALLQHESALVKALSESEQRTSAAIRAQQSRNRKLARTAATSWLVIGVPVAALVLLAGPLLSWRAQSLVEQERQIVAGREQLRKIEASGGTLVMTVCDGNPCARIDPEAKSFTAENGDEFRVLKLQGES